MRRPLLTRDTRTHAVRRAEVLVRRHEPLLMLLTTLHAASSESLRALHFGKETAPVSRRRALSALAALVEHHALARQELLCSRAVYHLGPAALTFSPRVRARVSDAARKPLSEELAAHSHLRASLWAELAKNGYRVGRGAAEQNALRRCLVDRQRKVVSAAKGGNARQLAERVLETLRQDRILTPTFRRRCPRCGWAGALNTDVARCAACGGPTSRAVAERVYRCPRCDLVSDGAELHQRRTDPRRRCHGVPREVDHLRFDVAWRVVDNEYDVILVFVDDQRRDLVAQLNELPLRVRGQPRLPIILRTTDPASIYDRRTATWVHRGDRHRALMRAFSDEGLRRVFPFVTTTELVEVNAGLQLYLNPDRKEHPHA